MSIDKSYKVAVIGGGIAGITAANELSKNPSFEISIFESQNTLGGLNQSVVINNLTYDIGAFIYSTDHSLFKAFPFLKNTYLPIEHYPISVKDKDKHDIHPLSIKGYWKNFGTINLLLSIISLCFAKIKYNNRRSLPEYCKYYLGERVYVKSGLQRYIKRLYKKEDIEVDVKLGYSRIKNISNYSFRNIIRRLAKLDSDNLFNAKKRKYYVRPESGFKDVFAELEKHLQNKEVQINKNCNIRSIQKTDNGFTVSTTDDNYTFDRIISTIPFSITQKLTGIETGYRPSFMKLLNLFYKAECHLDANVIYNYTNFGEWKRITIFSKYYGLEEKQDYFTVEITVNAEEEVSVESHREEFEKLVKKYDLAKNLEFQGSKIIPYAYPVFKVGETQIADQELKKIKDFGIDLVGRQGTFEFISSDETISFTQKYISETFEL